MDHIPDDTFLPCHWIRDEIREDRMVFRRDDDSFAISAVRREGGLPIPVLDVCYCWEIRCQQRAGEATSTTTLGHVTTRESALDTVIRHMDRINEAIESEGGLPPSSMVELLADGTTTGDGDRERTPTKRINANTLRL